MATTGNAHRATLTKRPSPDGGAVYVVSWAADDERRESGVADEVRRSWTFFDRESAEDLVQRLDAAAERDATVHSDTGPALEGWAGDETDDRSHRLPQNPWAERANALRKSLPRGVQGTGEVRRSTRVDSHGGDFATGRTLAPDDAANSAVEPTSGPVVGSTREWYRRQRPWMQPRRAGVTMRNGATHTVEVGLTRWEWSERERVRAEARAASTAANQGADQEFGTFPRRDRGTATTGVVDLDALGSTVYVFGSRRRVPESPPTSELAAELARADAVELQRARSAFEAAERRRDRDALAACSTPGCPNPGPLRRGLCGACRTFQRRNGFLPPPEVIRRRRWTQDAPITQ